MNYKVNMKDGIKTYKDKLSIFSEQVKQMNKEDLQSLADEMVSLVYEKNQTYGNSFKYSGEIIKILYPDGIKIDQYQDALLIIRVIDKLFRIANKKDAFEENPWKDIMGYSMLANIDDNNKSKPDSINKEFEKILESTNAMSVDEYAKLYEEFNETQELDNKEIECAHTKILKLIDKCFDIGLNGWCEGAEDRPEFKKKSIEYCEEIGLL